MDPASSASRGPSGLSRRRADRRAGIHHLVRDVAVAWSQNAEPDLKETVVGHLQRLLPAKTIRLNELSSATTIRVGQPVKARDYVAYAVPLADSGRRVVLEASFPGERGVDEWTCQMLETAANLTGLLLDAQRRARHSDHLTSGSGDGAAPLIGASQVMQGLRERVERVATTDFTVLIEGSICP